MGKGSITLRKLSSYNQEEKPDSSLRILTSGTTTQEVWALQQTFLLMSKGTDMQDWKIELFYNDISDLKSGYRTLKGLDYIVFPEKPTEKDLDEKIDCFEYTYDNKRDTPKIIDQKLDSSGNHTFHICQDNCFLEIPITNPKSRDFYIKSKDLCETKIFIAATSDAERNAIIRYMAARNTQHAKVLIAYPDMDLPANQRNKIIASSNMVIYPENYDKKQKLEDIEVSIKLKQIISFREFSHQGRNNRYRLEKLQEYSDRRARYKHRNEEHVMQQYDVGYHKLGFLPRSFPNAKEIEIYCRHKESDNWKNGFISTLNKTDKDAILDYIRDNVSDYTTYRLRYPEYEIDEERRHYILEKSDLVIYPSSEMDTMNNDILYMKEKALPYLDRFRILKKNANGYTLSALKEHRDNAPEYERRFFRREGRNLFIPTSEKLDSTEIIKYLKKMDFEEIHIETMMETDDFEYDSAYLKKIYFYLLPLTLKLLRKPDRNYNVFLEEIQAITKDKKATTRIIPINMQDLSSKEWVEMMEIYGDRIGHPQLLDYTRTQDIKPPQIFQVLLEEALHVVNEEQTHVVNEEQTNIDKAFNYKIFVSYRQKDRLLARAMMKRIHEEKDLEDIAFWYDQELQAGQDFETQIKNAMSEADLILMLVTDNMLQTTGTRITEDNNKEKGNYVSFTEYPMMGKMKEGQKVIPVAFYLTAGIFKDATPATIKSRGRKFSITFFSSKNRDKFNKMFPARKGVDELITDTDTLIERIRKYRKEALASKEDKESAIQKYNLSSFYQKGLRTDLNFNKTIELIEESVKMSDDMDFKIKANEHLLSIYRNGINNIKDYADREKAEEKICSLLEELTGNLKKYEYCTEALLAKTDENNHNPAEKAPSDWYEENEDIEKTISKSQHAEVSLDYTPNPNLIEAWFNKADQFCSYSKDEEIEELDEAIIPKDYDSDTVTYMDWLVKNADKKTIPFGRLTDVPEAEIHVGWIQNLDKDRLKESFRNRIALIDKIQGLLDIALQLIAESETSIDKEFELIVKRAYNLSDQQIFAMSAVILGLRTNTPLDNITYQDIREECKFQNRKYLEYFRDLLADDDLCIIWLTLKNLQYINNRFKFNYEKNNYDTRCFDSIHMWNMLDSMRVLIESFGNTRLLNTGFADSPIHTVKDSCDDSSNLNLRSKIYDMIETALLKGDNITGKLFHFKLNRTISRLSAQNYDLSENNEKVKATRPTYKKNACVQSKAAYESYMLIKDRDRQPVNILDAAKILCFHLYVDDGRHDSKSYSSIEELAWEAYKTISRPEYQDKYIEDYLNLVDIILTVFTEGKKINPYDRKAPKLDTEYQKDELSNKLIENIKYHIDSIIETSPSEDNIKKIRKISKAIASFAGNDTSKDAILKKLSGIDKKQRDYLAKTAQYRQLTDSHSGILSEEICARLPALCLDLMDNTDTISGTIYPYDLFKTLEYSMSVLASSEDENNQDLFNSNKKTYENTQATWENYKNEVIKCKKNIEDRKNQLNKAEARYKETLISRLFDYLEPEFSNHHWYKQDAFSIASKTSEVLKLLYTAPCTSDSFTRFVEKLCMPYLQNSENNNSVLQENIEQTYQGLKSDYMDDNTDTSMYRKQSAFYASLTYALLNSSYSSNEYSIDRAALMRYCYFLCRFHGMDKSGITELMPIFKDSDNNLENIFRIETSKLAVKYESLPVLYDAYHSIYASEEFKTSIGNYILENKDSRAIELFRLFQEELEPICTEAYNLHYRTSTVFRDRHRHELLNDFGPMTALKKTIISDIWESSDIEDMVFTLENYTTYTAPYLCRSLEGFESDIENRSSEELTDELIESLKFYLEDMVTCKEVLSQLSPRTSNYFTVTEDAIDRILRDFCPIMLYNHEDLYKAHPEIRTSDIKYDRIDEICNTIKKTIIIWNNLKTLLSSRKHMHYTDIIIYVTWDYTNVLERALQAIYVLYEKVNISSELKRITVYKNYNGNNKAILSNDNGKPEEYQFTTEIELTNSCWKSFYELWLPITRTPKADITWLPIRDKDAPIRHASTLMIEDIVSLDVMTEILKMDSTLHAQLRNYYSKLDKYYSSTKKDYENSEKVLVKLKKFNGSRYLALMADSLETASRKSNRLHNLSMPIKDKPLYPFAPDPYAFGIPRKQFKELQEMLDKYEQNHPKERKEYRKKTEKNSQLDLLNIPQEENEKRKDNKIEILKYEYMVNPFEKIIF